MQSSFIFLVWVQQNKRTLNSLEKNEAKKKLIDILKKHTVRRMYDTVQVECFPSMFPMMTTTITTDDVNGNYRISFRILLDAPRQFYIYSVGFIA